LSEWSCRVVTFTLTAIIAGDHDPFTSPGPTGRLDEASMNCCTHCNALEQTFGRKQAARDIHRYRRKGPDATTAAVVGMVRQSGAAAATLLDIGGGVGVIAFELLDQGVEHAVVAEAAPGYLEAARTEAHRRGATDRVKFVQGDFVDTAGGIESADVVTLNRVVCCYPDHAALLAAAASRCRTVLALSHPRERWAVRLFIRLENLVRRLRRDPFRTFVHPREAMYRVLADAGFVEQGSAESFVWRTVSFVRERRPSTA
jgi:2-polyprenyl-3-methyl-5-hydroxy-6-metoxy-1,4-benzoquinol methylase